MTPAATLVAPLDPEQLTEFRRGVLRFGRCQLRPLPWRATRDPWAVLVSEVMLQQTQVTRVEGRYRDFMALFPSVRSCANAPVADVVRAWHGLGYNRRAVQLHQAAQAVVERFGGVMPSELSLLTSLPGVGPYTARAVIAFAFEGDVAVVDVNVSRVLARAVGGRPLSASAAQRVADAARPKGRAWVWNQSLMELGATVCTARAPACGACAVARSCRWARAGAPAPDPAARARRQTTFEGSDRQGRGRLLSALRGGPVTARRLAGEAGWPDDAGRAKRIAQGLIADGLARRGAGGALTLP